MPGFGGRVRRAPRCVAERDVDSCGLSRQSPSRARAGRRRRGSRGSTVVWSRSKPRAISASESAVSSRARYIATCRGRGYARASAPAESSSLAAQAARRRRRRPGSRRGSEARPVGASAPRRRRAERAVGPSARDSGSLCREANAITRVIAPSSTRTFVGAAAAISRSTPGSGTWPLESAAIRQSTAIRVRRSGGSSSTRRPQLKRSRRRSASRERRLGRPVAREHDLLAGGVEGVEGVDELLLGVLLALEDLDVVDQQRVELAVARLERLRALAPQRGDELGR